MKAIKLVIEVMSGICLFLTISAGHAENWVRVGPAPDYNLIDVDSFRRGNDGLVYYKLKEEKGIYTMAVDCQKHIIYEVGGNPDWRSNGSEIRPGTTGVKESDFICSRAR